MPHRPTLCTLEDVAQQLDLPDANAVNGSVVPATSRGIVNADTNNKRDFVTTLIYDVSEAIELHQRRSFVPRLDTRYYTRRDIHDHRLWLDDDLLDATTVTNGNGDVIQAADYRLYPRNEKPTQYIYPLRSNNVYWQFDNTDSEISVAGVWGFHTNPDQMWRAIDTLSGSLTAGATSLTVTDSSIYEVLQYLRVNDEYLRVTAIDSDTDTLTLERGINGTTAAAHDATDTISAYQQMPDVRAECRRLVIKMFNTRSEMGDVKVFAGGDVMEVTKRDIRLNRKRITVTGV